MNIMTPRDHRYLHSLSLNIEARRLSERIVVYLEDA